MVVITIVRWGYKPTYDIWGPHLLYVCFCCFLHAMFDAKSDEKVSPQVGTGLETSKVLVNLAWAMLP